MKHLFNFSDDCFREFLLVYSSDIRLFVGLFFFQQLILQLLLLSTSTPLVFLLVCMGAMCTLIDLFYGIFFALPKLISEAKGPAKNPPTPTSLRDALLAG